MISFAKRSFFTREGNVAMDHLAIWGDLIPCMPDCCSIFSQEHGELNLIISALLDLLVAEPVARVHRLQYPQAQVACDFERNTLLARGA